MNSFVQNLKLSIGANYPITIDNNFLGGVTYDISTTIFIQVQYDFTKLNIDEVPDIKFNTNVNLLKIGVGFKL